MCDIEVDDHYNPTVRLINLERNGTNCGFQLTRGKWDPYPWVNSVDSGTAADQAGIKSGDCLLEVNGEDVLGRRICEVAEIVKSKPNQVSLLLWNAGLDTQCTPEAICCGPMPTNLQRLSACMSTILAFLECPVCLDTIPPPTYQCENGHLICMRCRTKSERCPVCRIRFSRGRCLLSDQVYNALIDTFNLREESNDVRTAKMQEIFKLKKKKNLPEIKITPSHTTKFLTKIVGKASSVENLSKLEDGRFNLRAKSLSTQDIYPNASPSVSRANSISKLNRNYLQPASCHGSFESLQRNDDSITFYCPFSSTCNSVIKGKTVIEHFQSVHDEPLIQFFKPHIVINFSKILESQNLCYLVSIENSFFLKVELNCENEDKSANVYLWTWLLDDNKAAKNFEMQVKVLTGDSQDVILSVRNNVLSLNSTSYNDVKSSKKGVFFNTKSIDSTKYSLNNIIFDINILKSDYL